MDLLIHLMEATPVFSSENFVIKSNIRRTCANSQSVTTYDSIDSIISINPSKVPKLSHLVDLYFSSKLIAEKNYNCKHCIGIYHEEINILESASDILIIEIFRDPDVRNIY